MTSEEAQQQVKTRRKRRDARPVALKRLREMRRKIEIEGFRAVDKRSTGAQSLIAWKRELVEALGGETQLSPQEITLVEQVTRLKLFLDHIDVYLLGLPSIIVRRKKKLIPLVKDRLALAAELRATLQLIGLKKIPKLVTAIDPERMEKILAVERDKESSDELPRPEERTNVAT